MSDGGGASRSKSVEGARNVGEVEIGSAVVGEVGGGGASALGGDSGASGDLMDEVFENMEMSVSGGVSGGAENIIVGAAEVPIDVGGGGGGEVIDVVGGVGTEEHIGEKEKETIGGNGGDGGGVIVGEGNPGDVNTGGNSNLEGGEETDGASAIGGVGGGDGVSGEDGVGGEDGAGGDNEVYDNEDSGGIDPIPLIPRWRLREILAHAEGECIMLLC